MIPRTARKLREYSAIFAFICAITLTLMCITQLNVFRVEFSRECSRIANAKQLELADPVVDANCLVNIKNEFGMSATGFFVSSDGYIVTAAHITYKVDILTGKKESSGKLTVTTVDGNIYSSEIIKVSKFFDIAVIRVKTSQKTPYLEFESTSDIIGKSITNYGLTSDLVKFFVSGRVVTINNISLISEDVKSICTDIMGYPGLSGSPLILNKTGKVVGVGSFMYHGYQHDILPKHVMNILYSIKRRSIWNPETTH